MLRRTVSILVAIGLALLLLLLFTCTVHTNSAGRAAASPTPAAYLPVAWPARSTHSQQVRSARFSASRAAKAATTNAIFTGVERRRPVGTAVRITALRTDA